MNAPMAGKDDYDTLPYRSVCYNQSQPSHMAAIAALFGLTAPDVATATVLELGCASGGNIIPLAALYPEARFIGIDLSERQVADGTARIAALGLANIEIRQGDIAALDLGAERIDYMICHGVYSWIPPEAQEAVLAVTARHMTDNGVAYVSYNTYPGWHLRTVIRDLCLYHAGTEGSPEYRVARARWALEKISSLSKDTSPHGQLLRNEAKLNAKLPDSYILGEFLATHNAPCFFHEFASRAGRHGLQFLAETDFASSIPESLDKETAGLIRSIAGKSGVALEQYMDFFVGRQFRRSLLVKSHQGQAISRAIGPDRIAHLNLSSPLKREETPDPNAPRKEGEVVFKTARAAISIKEPGLLAVLTFLQASYPQTRTLAEILGAVIKAGLPADAEAGGAIVGSLFRLIAGGHIEVSSIAHDTGRAKDLKPQAWPVARVEAVAGQAWASSRRHMPIGIDPVLAILLPLMDGTRSKADLRDVILDAILNGRLKGKGLEIMAQTSRLDMIPMADRIVNQALAKCERTGLLEPAISDA